MKISRSYARKISHENYGGMRFNMSDFFSCYDGELPDDATPEQQKELSNKLFELAKADVEESVKNQIKVINLEKQQWEKDQKELSPF